MSFYDLSPRTIRVGSLQLKNNVRMVDGSGFPTSGTTGSGLGAPIGSIYHDKLTGTQFRNAGTAASPYWYPVNVDSNAIAGVMTDFRGAVGRLGTATTAASYDVGVPAVRYSGNGIAANDANTAITPTYPLGGPLLTVGCDDQADFITGLSYGSTTALWTPAANAPLVIEANFTGITDILTRSFFLGFVGESADALIPPVTAATVTITFQATGTQGDNVHGLFMDSRLTAANSIFLPSVKANAVASVSTTTAALTVASTMPAAATYSRWRVEVDASGNLRAFINKVEVAKVATAVSTTVALLPLFGMANSTTTASLSMGVREFSAYAKR